MSGFLMCCWGKVRRYYLGHFRRGYIKSHAELRRGECTRCGDCCNIVFRCPFLKGKNHCKAYSVRSIACRVFPIDRRDILDVPTCSYKFGARQGAKDKAATRPNG